MAKMKRPPENRDKTGGAAVRGETQSALAGFLAGPKAKWAFFALYGVLTVFLFRDFLFSDTMLFGNDTIPDGVYTRQFYKDHHAEFGGIPRWNPLILGGLPFIDAMHGDTFYPGAWIKFFMPLTRALGHKLIWHVFLAGIFMYLFLRTLRVRRDAAFLGGLMYMLAPSFVSLVFPGHDAKMYIIAFLPLAFAFLEMGMTAPCLWKFVCLGAVMGLLILTSHMQMAYYSYWALGLWFLFRLFSARKEGAPAMARRTVMFVLAVVLAVALGLVQLLPSYTFTTSQSVRAGEERTSYDYATSWSMHPEEVMGMIVPSFPGFQNGFAENFYWGRNSFKLNSEYNGILPILFAVLALIAWRTGRTWFFLGLGALALIYAVGATTPLYHLFYWCVPGVKNFRAPGMIIFLFTFAAVVMSASFLSAFLDRRVMEEKNPGRGLLYAAGAVILIAVLFSALGRQLFNLWNGMFYSSITPEKAERLARSLPWFTRDLWRVALFASVALAGSWMFLSRKIGPPALVFLLALITVADEAAVAGRYITTIDPLTFPALSPDRSVRDIRAKMTGEDPFRILGMINGVHSGNYYAMFGIQSADGFHNNELQTYELFRDGRIGKNFLSGWVDLEKQTLNPAGISSNNFLKVAGVRYILLPAGQGRIELMENPAALGRAFIVHDFVVAKNDTAAVEMLKDAAFDPARTAVVNAEPATKPEEPADPAAVSRVQSLSYKAQGTEIAANLAAPGLVVLSDNWVPYWTAEVDGKPAPVLRAYGTFMAVAVPEGGHRVVFTFRSKPYETGKTITLAALGFIFLALAASGGAGFLRRGRTAV